MRKDNENEEKKINWKIVYHSLSQSTDKCMQNRNVYIQHRIELSNFGTLLHDKILKIDRICVRINVVRYMSNA